MRYPPHTRKEKEVWEVCDLLKVDGVNITYQAVGDKLIQLGYKRGSNSDLYRYITSWRRKKNRKAFSPIISRMAQAPLVNDAIPENITSEPQEKLANKLPPLPDTFERVQEEIWTEANKTIDSIEQEALDRISEAEARIEKLQKENITLKSLLEKAKEEIHALKKTNTGQPHSFQPNLAPTLEKILRKTIHEEFNALARIRDEELIKLYNHHQEQFDKYLAALDKVKAANALLKAQLTQKSQMSYETSR